MSIPFLCLQQTEILRVVFTMYFRILKHSRHSPLLRPVLRGLAKWALNIFREGGIWCYLCYFLRFAHLISVDFFSDLMSVLHSLAETGVRQSLHSSLKCASYACIMWLLCTKPILLQGLSNRECMQCVSTAFEILSGQGVYSAVNCSVAKQQNHLAY